MGFLGCTSLKPSFGTSDKSPFSTAASPILPEGTRVLNSTAFFQILVTVCFQMKH